MNRAPQGYNLDAVGEESRSHKAVCCSGLRDAGYTGNERPPPQAGYNSLGRWRREAAGLDPFQEETAAWYYFDAALESPFDEMK